MSLGKSIEHTMGRCRPALLHHTFVLSSSLSPDKVENELSHPSALWVPVFRCLGNKVIVLLLQNRESQSKQREIGQQGVVEEGEKSAICSNGSFGCIAGLFNKIRKNSFYSFRVFGTRLSKSNIIRAHKAHSAYIYCQNEFFIIKLKWPMTVVFSCRMLFTAVNHRLKYHCCP